MLDLVSKLQLSLTELGNSLLLAFLVISVTWPFHVRSFAIVRPSSFVLVTNSTSFPSMMMGSKTLCSLAKEILSSLHLSAFISGGLNFKSRPDRRLDLFTLVPS